MTPAAARELARLAELTQGRRPAAGARAEALRVVTEAAGLQDRPEASSSLLSTGDAVLDAWLGGLPGGRVTEVVGPASAGKTTLAMGALKAALEATGRTRLAALVDLTRTVAPQEAWTRSLLVVRPRRVEIGLRALDVLLDSAAFSLVVLHLPPSLRALPEPLKVRATRLCREAGTALMACGDHPLFGSSSALRLELQPGRSALHVRVTKNRQGPVGELDLAARPLLRGVA
jgi:replicative DNA helicase